MGTIHTLFLFIHVRRCVIHKNRKKKCAYQIQKLLTQVVYLPF